MYVHPNLPLRPTLSFPHCVHMSSLCLHLYPCPANSFTCTIFLDSTYMLIIQYMFFSFWLTSLCMTNSMGFPGGSVVKNPQVQFLGWEDPLGWKWLPIPVFLPGESHWLKSWVGYSPWGRDCTHVTDARAISLRFVWLWPLETPGARSKAKSDSIL